MRASILARRRTGGLGGLPQGRSIQLHRWSGEVIALAFLVEVAALA
jgi:hypothetical protein